MPSPHLEGSPEGSEFILSFGMAVQETDLGVTQHYGVRDSFLSNPLALPRRPFGIVPVVAATWSPQP